MKEDKADHKDIADFVDITVHEITVRLKNQTYPEPTRETITKAVREYLQENKFSYSEKRYSHHTLDINESAIEEPITSSLETFGDIDDGQYIKHNIPQSHTEKEHEGWPTVEKTAAGLGIYQGGWAETEELKNFKQKQKNLTILNADGDDD